MLRIVFSAKIFIEIDTEKVDSKPVSKLEGPLVRSLPENMEGSAEHCETVCDDNRRSGQRSRVGNMMPKNSVR